MWSEVFIVNRQSVREKYPAKRAIKLHHKGRIVKQSDYELSIHYAVIYTYCWRRVAS